MIGLVSACLPIHFNSEARSCACSLARDRSAQGDEMMKNRRPKSDNSSSFAGAHCARGSDAAAGEVISAECSGARKSKQPAKGEKDDDEM